MTLVARKQNREILLVSLVVLLLLAGVWGWNMWIQKNEESPPPTPVVKTEKPEPLPEPEQPDQYYYQSLAELRQSSVNSKNIDKAIDLQKKAIQADPQNTLYHLALLETYINQGNMIEAGKELDQLESLGVDSGNLKPLQTFLSYWQDKPADLKRFDVPAPAGPNQPHLYSISWSHQGARMVVRVPEAIDQAAYFLLEAESGDLKKIGTFPAPPNQRPLLWTPDDSQVLVPTPNEVLLLSILDWNIVQRWTHKDILRWALSPSGDKLAYSDTSGIWLSTPTGNSPTLIKESRGQNESIVAPLVSSWSPDEARLLFINGFYEGSRGLYELDLATGQEKMLCDFYDIIQASYSPDGQRAAFSQCAYGAEHNKSYILEPGSPVLEPREVWGGVSLPRLSWGADGNKLYFESNWPGGQTSSLLWCKSADGKQSIIPISYHMGIINSWAISAAGDYCAYFHQPVDGVPATLWIVRI